MPPEVKRAKKIYITIEQKAEVREGNDDSLDDDGEDDDDDELEVEEDHYDEVEGDVDNDDGDEGRAIEDEEREVAEEEEGVDGGCAEGLRGDAAVAASTFSTNTADRDLDAELEEIYNKVTGDTEAEETPALGKHGRDGNSTSSSSTSGSSLPTTQTKFVKATKTPVMQKCRPSTPWILKSFRTITETILNL
jgi:hypothetical protein